jgi:hypothetical protein
VLLRTAIALLIVSMPAGAAWSQTVTLEAQPSVVEIPPWGRQAEARIVLRNPRPEMLVRPTITSFTNDSLHVNIDRPMAAGLGRKDTLVWKVGIDQLNQATIPGSVQFEVTYGIAGETGVQRLYTTVKVQASAATDKALEASVQGSFDTITEKRQGTGYLLVTNSLDVPIRIRRVTILQPGTTGARAGSSSFKNPSVEPNQFTVSERSSTIAEITLPAADAVTPGKQTVVFDVEAEWTNGGHQYTRHLMVNKEVNVGIFFESDLLKALGVPSFLLVPGCLFLFTMQLLLAAGLFGVDRYSKLPSLPVSSPGFWIIAVTYSGVFAWAYTSLTGSDYLIRYGSRDLRNVWLWSIVIGCAVYSGFALVTLWQRRHYVPDTADDEIETLVKMDRRNAGILARKVKFKLSGEELSAFLIEPLEDGQASVWAAPLIQVKWGDSDRLGDRKSDSLAQKQKVRNLIDTNAAAIDIGDALREARVKEYATVKWVTQGFVKGPYHIDVQKITTYEVADQMVRLE